MKHIKDWNLLIVTFLFACLVAQVSLFIVSHSNTYDEAAFIVAGVSYLKTGQMEIEQSFHPPLQKYLAGFSVLTLHPYFNFTPEQLKIFSAPFGCFPMGYWFFYANTVKPEILLAMGRLPTLLLSLLLAMFVYAWTERWFGWKGGLLALAAYVFEPNILAHSGLATMDIGVSCFLFMATYFLVRYLEEEKTWQLILTGVSAGLAISTKLPGVVFFLWMGGLLYISYRNKFTSASYKKSLRVVSLVTLLCAAVIVLVYQVRYIDKFFHLISFMSGVTFKTNSIQDYPNFLHGQLKVGGWWYFYLVNLLIKTPLPFLILTGLGIWFVPRKKKIMLLFPAVSFLIIVSLAHKQHGLRYLLPIFPFLCVLIGGLSTLKGRPWARPVLFCLMGWSCIEAAAIGPNYLTYFNQLVGGPKNGYKWLVDCNLDWGQDFPAIRDYLRQENFPETIVAVFGNGDRDHYFNYHQDLIADPNNLVAHFNYINSLHPKRELLIISATLLQGFGLSQPNAFAWLKEQKPVAQIANSTFVYDVTTDAVSLFNMGLIYKANHQKSFAFHQFERTAHLLPQNPIPVLAMGDIYLQDGNVPMARKKYKLAYEKALAAGLVEQQNQIVERLKKLPPL